LKPAAALDRMVVIAQFVSRVEALVLVSALETAGIIARADGIHHASVEVNSLALGGHRIWVPASQLDEASAIIREIGVDRNWEFSRGLQRAVLRFVGLWLAIWAPALVVAVSGGVMSPLAALVQWPLMALSVPVNPQGPGEFYLAGAAR
jgi:hypothetical protein